MEALAFEMMKGSEKHMDYVVLARRGRFKIGLKVVGVANTKIAGKSYVAIRIRSAYDEGYEPPKVPNLALEKLTLESAWPGVKFENVNDERASTNGGVQTACFPSSKALWSAGRWFTPTAGGVMPDWRRPVTSIRSRSSAAAPTRRTKSCRASTSSPRCSSDG